MIESVPWGMEAPGLDVQRIGESLADWQRRIDEAYVKPSRGRAPTKAAINKILEIPELFQLRSLELDPDDVARLVTTIRAIKDSIDPVEVVEVRDQPTSTDDDGKRFLVINGHHRMAAFRKLGWLTVPIKRLKGKPSEYLLPATKENFKTRVLVSSRTRTQASWRLVYRDIDLSLTGIANATGVSKRTVATQRKVFRWFAETYPDIELEEVRWFQARGAFNMQQWNPAELEAENWTMKAAERLGRQLVKYRVDGVRINANVLLMALEQEMPSVHKELVKLVTEPSGTPCGGPEEINLDDAPF